MGLDFGSHMAERTDSSHVNMRTKHIVAFMTKIWITSNSELFRSDPLINTVCTRCSFIISCWNVKVYFAKLGGGSRVVRVVYSWACCLVYEVYSCTQNLRSWHYNFGQLLTDSPCLVTRKKIYTSMFRYMHGLLKLDKKLVFTNCL